MEEWLRSIGLAHRVAAFLEQAIEVDHLSELSDEHLRELGLTIGERLRFRRALAAGTEAPAPEVVSPVATRAERRPLTMVFVDLVNSTALAERLDPEDLMEVIRLYREFCGTAIMRFGGHIARLVGDGIFAYFCYPVANENDPERAVRAALALTRGIGSLVTPARDPLNVRIGMATGRVIVSDLFAGGEADKRTIMGPTPHLASRLQGLAPPGGIVIAEETQARVRKLFSFEDLGVREIRGFDQPHRAWRVLGELPQHGRAHRTERPKRLTAFHNRRAELEALGRRWEGALRGEGGTVLVIGEPGIGKSRLIEKFLTTRAESVARIMPISGSPFDEDSPLRPVITGVLQAAGIELDDPTAAKMAKLEAILIGDAAERRRILPIIAELMGVPCENGGNHHTLSPAQFREQALDILTDQILRLSDHQPVCLMVEDLHWVDPTTREMLGRIAAGAATRRVMILLSAREGLDHGWAKRPGMTVIHLLRLPPSDVESMVQDLFRNRPISSRLIGQIATRTDGVPLFVEEVARSLLEHPSLPGLNDALGDDPDQAIPASLHESLMARLDRSGVAKDLAQIAAVIGRSARLEVLAAMSDSPAAEMSQALAMLTASGVLGRADTEGQETYTFSHALLADAAYDSLLRDRKRSLHLRLARVLQELDPGAIEKQPEMLALHLMEGGLFREAAEHWMEAAKRSLARSALIEATRLLRRGLAALDRTPPSEQTTRLRLQLAALLGPALISLKGPGSPDTQELYAGAYELCRELPEEPSLFPIYWGWWRMSQDFRAQLDRSRSLLDRAVQRNDPEFMLQAHHCRWASHYHAAEFGLCCEHIKAGLAVYEQGDYRHHARLYGNHDAKVCAHGEFAQLLWMQGKVRSALIEEHKSLEWGSGLDHVGSHVHAMDFALLHRIYRRDFEQVFERAGKFVTFTSDHALVDHRSRGLIFRGWAAALLGDPSGGLKTLEEGLAQQRQCNIWEDFPIYFCLLAEALTAAGMPDRAIEELQAGRREFESLGLQVWKPEVLRVTGEAVLAADPDALTQAQLLFTEAASIAERQGVWMLGLRVAVSQARIDVRLGRFEEAYARLAEALARMPDEDGSADFTAAKALLAAIVTRLKLPADRQPSKLAR